MDVNDLEFRINRAIDALNSRIDDDYQKHIKVEHKDKGFTLTLPGNDSKYTISNKAINILQLLATFKDHLINSLKKIGLSKEIVENRINNSLHLQVLVDLVNLEKHGEPLRNYRSGKKPIIKNIEQGVINNNDDKPIIVGISPNGEWKMLDGKPPSVVLIADIFHEDGTRLFDLDELVETTFANWLLIAYEHNLLQ